MAFTTMTVTMLSCFIALTIATIAGHYSGRNPDAEILNALILSLVVIPLFATILSIPLYNLVTLNDWPNSAYVLPPQFATWVAAVLGGFLGFRSGMIWNQGEASCIYCLLSVVLVLTGLSLVVVIVL